MAAFKEIRFFFPCENKNRGSPKQYVTPHAYQMIPKNKRSSIVFEKLSFFS